MEAFKVQETRLKKCQKMLELECGEESRGHCTQELIGAMVICTRLEQEQANQHSTVDVGRAYKAPPLAVIGN